MNRYDVKSILESSTLPIGGAAKRLKDADEQVDLTIMDPQTPHVGSNINIFGASHSLAFHKPRLYLMDRSFGARKNKILVFVITFDIFINSRMPTVFFSQMS